MIRLSEIKLTLDQAAQPLPVLLATSARVLGISPDAIAQVSVFKRSFDARRADLVAVFTIDVTLADPAAAARVSLALERLMHFLGGQQAAPSAGGHEPAAPDD